jgi:hypothetical protein
VGSRSTARRSRGTADPSAALGMTRSGLVPRLRRSDHLRYRFPALPGWADVLRSALRALHPWRLPVSFLPQLAAGKLAARDDKGDGRASIEHSGASDNASGDMSLAPLPSIEALPSPLSSRAQPRDLPFRGPFLDMLLDGYAVAVNRGQRCPGDDDPKGYALQEGPDADLAQCVFGKTGSDQK